MKKGLIFLLCAILFAALVVGGIGWFTWQSVNENAMPRPQLQVMGQNVPYASYEWQAPVFGGLLYKGFYGTTGNTLDLGEVPAGTAISVQAPSGFESYWQDDPEGELTDVTGGTTLTFTEPGSYHAEVVSSRPQLAKGEGYGLFTYDITFTVVPAEEPPPEEPALPATPTMTTSAETLRQGDVFSVRLYAIDEGVTPTATTDLGLAVFTPCADAGGWYCAIPIGNTREPGQYDVQVRVGEGLFWNAPVTVEKFDFVEQDLTIDVTDPVISEANSAAAYQQYREKIPPLFNTWDEERYWQGTFIQPAEGRISTEFGTIRYTNGDYANPSRHWGMDIANAEGTPVLAPAAGRVVLAENLLNTGNTVVIEHGGGLKSYYFHMVQLNVAEGDMVEQAQQIGAIGTTGYSTGPHLHFEVRIGNQAISPHMLFEDTAGLYAAEAPDAITAPLDE